MTIFMAFRERLLSIMEQKNINMYRLAVKSGLAHSTVRHIVLGEISNIKLDTLYALCSALEISLSELFDDSIFNTVDE